MGKSKFFSRYTSNSPKTQQQPKSSKLDLIMMNNYYLDQSSSNGESKDNCTCTSIKKKFKLKFKSLFKYTYCFSGLFFYRCWLRKYCKNSKTKTKHHKRLANKSKMKRHNTYIYNFVYFVFLFCFVFCLGPNTYKHTWDPGGRGKFSNIPLFFYYLPVFKEFILDPRKTWQKTLK